MRYWEIIRESSSLIKIEQLRLDRRSVTIALRDLMNQKWSHTTKPVEICGEYEVRDGYHRVLEQSCAAIVKSAASGSQNPAMISVRQLKNGAASHARQLLA